jgi:hypothetical protein
MQGLLDNCRLIQHLSLLPQACDSSCRTYKEQVQFGYRTQCQGEGGRGGWTPTEQLAVLRCSLQSLCAASVESARACVVLLHERPKHMHKDRTHHAMGAVQALME